MILPYFSLDCLSPDRVSRGQRNSVRRFRLAGVALCLPVLLAAAPEPKPVPARPAEHVKSVPPDQDIAVLGQNVSTPSGKTIGRLIDVLVDAAGKPEAAVIDFGGFMGVGARKIAVHWSTLHFAPADRKTPITLDLTVDQIKAAPEYKDTSRPVSVVVKPKSRPEPPTITPATTEPAAPAADAPSVRQ